MNRRRAGLVALCGVAIALVAIEPAAAQSTESTVTEDLIWGLNGQLLYVAVPITVLVEGILIYTVWKYRKNDDPQPTQENRRLEITWTIATAIILLFVGVASYQVLGNPYVAAGSQGELQEPDNVEEITVFAQRYSFAYEYDGIAADGISGEGLTLEGVTVEGATVTNRTDEGIRVSDARISGSEIDSGTLESGLVTGVDRNRTGDDVTFDNVTVESANITETSIENASVGVTTTVVMPKDRDVRFNITSRDWNHAFHVPGLGLKKDAFPGEWNQLNTRALETGEYQLYCAEYCGSGHSSMLGTVEVRSQDDYRDWLRQQWVDAQN
jgi:cytochrome c oxidase subunit II